MDELTLLKSENARLKALLSHAVKQADDWFDECRGAGLIEGDPLIDEARRMANDLP